MTFEQYHKVWYHRDIQPSDHPHPSAHPPQRANRRAQDMDSRPGYGGRVGCLLQQSGHYENPLRHAIGKTCSSEVIP
jgi:hypothetical protein